MFKLTLATLMLVTGLCAHATDYGYKCTGTTVDGIDVTVQGRWDSDYREATSPMYVSSSDDFDSSSIPGMGGSANRAHGISKSAVKIYYVGDSMQIVANANHFNVFLSYPNMSSGSTVMNVDIGAWNHQFTHARCQVALP